MVDEMHDVAWNLIFEKRSSVGEINPHCYREIRKIFLDRYPGHENTFDKVYDEITSPGSSTG